MRALMPILLCIAACATDARPGSSPPRGAVQDAAPARAQDPEPVGSLRNARVAIERGPGSGKLVYFARQLDEGERHELERIAPGVELVVGLTREQALERAAEAHGMDGSYATPEILRAATRLVWVQAGSAGVERYVGMPELRDEERIVLTNMAGVHGPAIADHAFGMLLVLTRDLPVHLAGRAQGRWQREGSGELEPIALAGRTLLVVGLGGIGTEIARRAHGFGMRVIATRRSETPGPDYVERVAKPDALFALLGEADVVAIAVPLTEETEGLFGAEAFAAMKPGSYLINVGRGRVVDTDALLDALQSKRLAGACLDVTDPEPLPSDHPLWGFPNVVITPHVSSRAELTGERADTLFHENLRRFDAGLPLLNVVDKQAGY